MDKVNVYELIGELDFKNVGEISQNVQGTTSIENPRFEHWSGKIYN